MFVTGLANAVQWLKNCLVRTAEDREEDGQLALYMTAQLLHANILGHETCDLKL